MASRNPPPPPILTSDRSRSRHANSTHSRHSQGSARSRSPIHRRDFGPSRFHDDKDRPRGRQRSPDYDDRKLSALKPSIGMLPPPSLGGIGNTFGLEPSVSRVTGIPEREIIRRILAPESVAIPRRAGEGARPIFEREELRESIERRVRSGDNDMNPSLVEQRVVAIIREPMIADSYLASRSTLQSLPSSSSARADISERQTTSTGVSYRLKPTTPAGSYGLLPRARSVEKPGFDRDRERDRERLGRFPRGPEPGDRKKFPDSRPKLESRDKRRRTRSRSVTPPPMPPDMQRNLVSRNPGGVDTRIRRSFEGEHDSRDRDSSFRGRGGRGGMRRSRGGGPSFGRGFGSRTGGRSPRNWEHDMYDRDRGGDESQDAKRSGK